MKTGKTLQELAAELDRQSNAKADFVVDSRRLQFITSGAADERGRSELDLIELGDDGAGFVVNDWAHGQIADRLGIPKRYYDRLRFDHASILDANVNGLFQREPSKKMIRTFDWGGGERTARAFLSDRYRRLDNDELAQAALPILGEIPDVQIMSCELTETRMYIKAVTPRVQAEVKRGDVVQAGVVIRNSEVGAGALTVQPLVYRLVCTNGMIAGEAVRKYHIGRQVDSDDSLNVFRDETVMADDRAFFLKLEDVVRAAVSETQFLQIVEQMRELAETEKMADPVATVERLGKRFGFGEGEQRSVLRHLIEGADLTAFGALNAITRTAEDIDSYDRATEFETFGGQLLALRGKEWRELASA